MEQVEPILLKLNHQNLSIISDSIDRKRMAWFGISFASMGVRRGRGVYQLFNDVCLSNSTKMSTNGKEFCCLAIFLTLLSAKDD